ncbi:Btb/poz domain-containing protein [Pandoravirus kuranda]|uniref:Btb/poz domain-containing protein n=1 Tax=Pandoravirus kuranda TaxID=3019033 RepID=A0AA95J3H9_9VIRU|nr:Btb/poz domain-containing protein [Pandoravirus kuranda]
MYHRALASIRNDYPDCVIESRPCHVPDGGVNGACRRDHDDDAMCDSDTGSPVIVGHRAVLSKLPYFAALFARADPERIDRDGPEGSQRSFRLVYGASIPFRRDSLTFLVGLLYGTVSHFAIASRCADPVDTIGAAVYLGLDAARTESIVERVAVVLLRALGRAQRSAHQENGGDGDNDVGDAYRRLASFTLHMADSDLPVETKRAVLGRMFGLLDDADRAGVDKALVPADYYRPDAVGVGTVEADPGGVRWRHITLACDQYSGGWGASVSHQGLVFCVKASCGTSFEEEEVTVSILVTPEGEALGSWKHSKPAPDGAIDVVVRCMTARVEAYHPVAHVAACERTLWSRPAHDTRRAPAFAVIPKGAVPVPCGFAKTARDGRTVTRRCPLNVTLDDLIGRNARAVACLVRIRVQEQAPPAQ